MERVVIINMKSPESIEALLKALNSAPQDKEGSFRISTWKMVLEEFYKMKEELNFIKKSLGTMEKTTKEIASNQINTEEIKKSIKDDISKTDAAKILF